MDLAQMITQHLPHAPDWLLGVFEQFDPTHIHIYYNIALWAIVLFSMYMLSAFQRKYSELLIQLFSAWWVLNQPYNHGMLTLNLTENPILKNGIVSFFSSFQNIILFIQMIAGIFIVLRAIRYILIMFIVTPIRYRLREREGSAYEKKALRKHQRMAKKKEKAQSVQMDHPSQEKVRVKHDKPHNRNVKIDNDINNYL